MSEIIAKAMQLSTEGQAPEIGRIDYDLWTLRVTLHFGDAPPAYLTFKDVSGIRVLREGDLIEYWTADRPQGWLWEIASGGWKSLESQRSGFISGQDPAIREFLVCGLVDCLSVLSSAEPQFTAIEP